MEEKKSTAVVKKDIGTQVIERITSMVSNEGLVLPQNYNHVNAIKASMLKLSELCDTKTGKSFMEVCTPASIQSALYKMATRGLDVSKQQGDFIVRGNKLCFSEEYFGKITLIRRVYPKWHPVTHVIYEGDDFQYGIDPETGYNRLICHKQDLKDRDPNKWVGGWVYLPCPDGKQTLYVMSRYEIEAAWAHSSNKSLFVHKQHLEKMVGKTLINSGSTLIVNPSDSVGAPVISDELDTQEPVDADYEEVDANSNDEVETVEVIEETPDDQPMQRPVRKPQPTTEEKPADPFGMFGDE